MTDTEDSAPKKKLSLAPPGKLELKKTVEGGQVRQNFSHGRSKVVTVEVKKKNAVWAEHIFLPTIQHCSQNLPPSIHLFVRPYLSVETCKR